MGVFDGFFLFIDLFSWSMEVLPWSFWGEVWLLIKCLDGKSGKARSKILISVVVILKEPPFYIGQKHHQDLENFAKIEKNRRRKKNLTTIKSWNLNRHLQKASPNHEKRTRKILIRKKIITERKLKNHQQKTSSIKNFKSSFWPTTPRYLRPWSIPRPLVYPHQKSLKSPLILRYHPTLYSRSQILNISLSNHTAPLPYNHHDVHINPKVWHHISWFWQFFAFFLTSPKPPLLHTYHGNCLLSS